MAAMGVSWEINTADWNCRLLQIDKVHLQTIMIDHDCGKEKKEKKKKKEKAGSGEDARPKKRKIDDDDFQTWSRCGIEPESKKCNVGACKTYDISLWPNHFLICPHTVYVLIYVLPCSTKLNCSGIVGITAVDVLASPHSAEQLWEFSARSGGDDGYWERGLAVV